MRSRSIRCGRFAALICCRSEIQMRHDVNLRRRERAKHSCFSRDGVLSFPACSAGSARRRGIFGPGSTRGQKKSYRLTIPHQPSVKTTAAR